MHSSFVLPQDLYSLQFLLITAAAFANVTRLADGSSAALAIKLSYSSVLKPASFASVSSRISSAISVFPVSSTEVISSDFASGFAFKITAIFFWSSADFFSITKFFSCLIFSSARISAFLESTAVSLFTATSPRMALYFSHNTSISFVFLFFKEPKETSVIFSFFNSTSCFLIA